jgi:predicted O-linked N-acetylglucosamine transferase (SPINDLY family)
MFNRLRNLTSLTAPVSNHLKPATEPQVTPAESASYKEQGDAHLMRNNLNEAKACYRHAISLGPDNAKAHSNLGYVLRELGNLDDAEHCLQTALSIDPGIADAHYMLGTIFQIQGQHEKSIDHFRKTLELDPDHQFACRDLCYILVEQDKIEDAKEIVARGIARTPNIPDYHYYLGNLHAHTKELDKASACYTAALAIQPAYVEVYFNFGKVLQEQGRLEEATVNYNKAIALKPDYAEVLNELGVTLMGLGRYDEAEASYRRAILAKPDNAEAHKKLGDALFNMGSFVEAEASYRQTIQIRPDYGEAHNHLGATLYNTGRFVEAEASCRRALKIKPDYAEAYNTLGAALQNTGRFVEAEASYRQALKINPDYADAHNNLGATLIWLNRLSEAETCFRRALQISPDNTDAHGNLIFAMDMMIDKDIGSLQEERCRWDAVHGARLHQRRVHSNAPDPRRRLRIGYVSGGFLEHSAAKTFGGMLTRYDRTQFDVFAYANHKRKDDGVTELFRQSVTAWRNIGRSPDDAVAKMILEDQIDILVDLSGHGQGNRLPVFARKPAPIQITAWGYAHGTGMHTIDVFFTDPVSVPPQEKQYFREEIRYLPCVVGAFFNEPFPDVNELPALSDRFITFGSLNRLSKVSAEACCTWAEVLLAVPRSRLLLKTPELDDASNRERIISHLTEAGVADDRIVMQGRSSWSKHMQAYNQIDLALDPFPHGGGVTAQEGLMMGVPAISLRWPTTAGRVSASIMTALGLTDWIAETKEQYVELAVQKASNLQSLSALRRQLRGIFTSSVMGDPLAYARAVEQEYRNLWREWCARVSSNGREPFKETH